MDANYLSEFDKAHVWHPYSGMYTNMPVYSVASAEGVRLTLTNGQELVDGMSSWWCAIHGYNHPQMNQKLTLQLQDMAHVMFGGLTHEPAVLLAEQLIALTPDKLEVIFFADSGSIAVEIAMKMAIQYWYAQGYVTKQRFLTIRNGYHGDTFGAMSVCDPDTGMHHLFQHVLAQQYFVKTPYCNFGEPCSDKDISDFEQTLHDHHQHIAAVIMEPIVQGAGGMKFYSAEYLSRVRKLCDHYKVLLILDEIATGFGRTGKLFACEYANVVADIMCLGKALTGGYMNLAATLTSKHIAEVISSNDQHGESGVLMHGPTFMANPLACTAALTSINILLADNWQDNVLKIENQLIADLESCRSMSAVADVRVLGAIGVVELHTPVDMRAVQPLFVDAGVWIRPFGKLIYVMPPFIINRDEVTKLTLAIKRVVKILSS